MLYADIMTKSLTRALAETDRRRKIQIAYNKEHNITPTTIKQSLGEIHNSAYEKDSQLVEVDKDNIFRLPRGLSFEKYLDKLRKEMLRAASDLDFEKAAKLRDEVRKIEKQYLKS